MGQNEKLAKLIAKAKQSPNNFAFSDLVHLWELLGADFERQRGSHKIYRHPLNPAIINIQDSNGKAKVYQVRQALQWIEDYSLV